MQKENSSFDLNEAQAVAPIEQPRQSGLWLILGFLAVIVFLVAYEGFRHAGYFG